MISDKSKEIILRAMQNAKGDDYERAQRAWGNLPAKMLDVEYGRSGKTVRAHLEAYEKDRREWILADKELRELFNEHALDDALTEMGLEEAQDYGLADIGDK